MRSEDESVSGMMVGVVCSTCRVDLSYLDSGALQRGDILLLTIRWSVRSVRCSIGSVTALKINYQILNLLDTLPLLADDLISHSYIRGYNQTARVSPSFFTVSFL